MKIYRISATQGQISFKKDIEANSMASAKNKFYNLEHKYDSYSSFGYMEPIGIKSITRRY